MAISVECPGCGKRYRVDDERAGQSLDCRECGEEIEIPGGARRRSGGSSGKRTKPRKKAASGGLPPAMIGIIGGGVVVVVGVLVFFAFQSKPAPAPAPVDPNGVAANPSPAPNPAPVPNPAANPNAAPVNPDPGANPNPPANPAPGVAQNPPILKAAGNGFQGGQGGAGAKFGFKPVNWKLQPDPLPAAVPFGDAPQFQVRLKGGYLGDDSVIYPVTPSSFVLASESDGKGSRDVWNLATGKKAGSLKGQNISGTNVAISPDGKYVGWFRFEARGGIVEVWDVPAKKSLGGISVDPSKFNMAVLAIPSPDRMVAFSDVNHALLSWKLPSGELEREQVLGDKCRPGDRHAFSPGGRYAVFLSDYLAKTVAVYDFQTGQLAELQFDKRPGNEFLGMDFSADGEKLALVFEGESPSYGERILIVKTSDATLMDTITLDEGLKKEHGLHGKGTSVQWFPNGTQLLLHGIGIVDITSRKVVYSFGKPGLDAGSLKNRRVLADGLIADWQGTRQESSLQPLSVSAADIAKSIAAVEAGGLMVDSRLPPLTRFDASGVRDRSGDQSPGWQGSADPASATADLLKEPLPLKGTGQVRHARFSAGNDSKAFLRMAEGEEPGDLKNRRPEMRFRAAKDSTVHTQYFSKPIHCKKNGIDVYDLAKRELVKRIDIDFSCDLLAASPLGTRILVAPHDGEGRVDVYSVSDGAHVAGCRPFQNGAKAEDRDLQTVFFVDEDHVGTVSFEDRLIVWKLPECTPVYELTEVVAPAISPGGKFLAVAQGMTVSLRDPRTGAALGDLQMEGPIRTLAFHPEGQRLAVVCSVRRGWFLYEIDMNAGRASEPIPLPVDVSFCQWVGDKYLLLNRSSLLDLEQKTVAWSYEVPDADSISAVHPSDLRYWLVAKAARGAAVLLAAIELPDPAAASRLGTAKLEPKMVVQPGGSITVMSRIPERPDRPGFQAEALGLLNAAVERSGVKDVVGQPVKLAVNMEFKTGDTVAVRFFGTGGQQQAQLQEKSLEITVAYDFNGAALWKTSTTITNLGTIVRVPSVEAAQKAIDDQMWDRGRGFLDALQLPAYVFSQESVYGLGTSTLSGDGAKLKGK